MAKVSSRARSAIAVGHNIKLNIGGGDKAFENYLNVDIRALPTTDIVADLNKKLDVIPDNSVEKIYSSHALEHVENLELLLSEFQRICVDGAKLTIIVPHFSNPFGYSDPTHKRFFGIYSFSYYSKTKYFDQRTDLPNYNPTIAFVLSGVKVRFYRNSRFDKIFNPWVERLINKRRSRLEFYEYRLSRIFSAKDIIFSLRVSKRN
jgi:ubiquinone/menaquinone biosynthesis C-methylase UbiE